MNALAPLYQLATEYSEAAGRLHDLGLPEEVIADTLESMAGDVEVKCQNVAFVVRNYDAMIGQIKKAEAAMATRRKALEARRDRIREYLHSNMERCGISKIETPWFALTIKNNPESVQIIDEAAIPPDCLREIPARHEPDKTLIKQAIKDGYDVPGCTLKCGTRLEIK